MAINFPTSPTNGQAHTEGGVTWTYNSTKTAWIPVVTVGINPWTVLGTLNPVAVPYIDTPSLVGFNSLKIRVAGLLPAANAGLTIQKSTNGSIYTDWSDGVVKYIKLDGTPVGETLNTNPTGDNFLTPPNEIGPLAASGGWSGHIELYNFNSAKICIGNFHGLYKDKGSSYQRVSGDFFDTGVVARTHLRFIFNGGINIASGKVLLEGLT